MGKRLAIIMRQVWCYAALTACLQLDFALSITAVAYMLTCLKASL